MLDVDLVGLVEFHAGCRGWEWDPTFHGERTAGGMQVGYRGPVGLVARVFMSAKILQLAIYEPDGQCLGMRRYELTRDVADLDPELRRYVLRHGARLTS